MRTSAASVSIGIDVLEPDRLARALERRPGLRARLFSEAELAYAGERPQSLAARFCAKEAVTKALRLDHFAPRDIEVLAGPELRLHGAAAARAAELGVEVEVSLTHVRGLAAAVALTR